MTEATKLGLYDIKERRCFVNLQCSVAKVKHNGGARTKPRSQKRQSSHLVAFSLRHVCSCLYTSRIKYRTQIELSCGAMDWWNI